MENKHQPCARKRTRTSGKGTKRVIPNTNKEMGWMYSKVRLQSVFWNRKDEKYIKRELGRLLATVRQEQIIESQTI